MRDTEMSLVVDNAFRELRKVSTERNVTALVAPKYFPDDDPRAHAISRK